MTQILLAQSAGVNGNVGAANRNANTPQEGGAAGTVVPAKITDPLKGQSLLGVGLKLINFMLAMIVIAAVVVIIVAGFRMITGGGNPSQVSTAKKAIVWAVVGIVVAFMSFAIVAIIQRLL
ncbi:MAG TPA: hypothetical protein VHQ20_02825 [Patescibacteria group bacterium]|jgi:hypothetical protein|nr:hypothetical protein [Patescibacteria group bacterium]